MAQSFERSAGEASTSWSGQARDMGQQALDSTLEATTATRDMVKGHPTVTLAIVGGLAFAVGALWMLSRSRFTHPSLVDRLADLQRELPRRWRT